MSGERHVAVILADQPTGGSRCEAAVEQMRAASGCERSVITPPIDDCFEEEPPLVVLAMLAFARPSTRYVEKPHVLDSLYARSR